MLLVDREVTRELAGESVVAGLEMKIYFPVQPRPSVLAWALGESIQVMVPMCYNSEWYSSEGKGIVAVGSQKNKIKSQKSQSTTYLTGEIY